MANALLNFRDVTLVRGLHVIVQDFNLAIEPGQIWALKGENGAGKTSVLRAGARLLLPFAGEVSWAAEMTVRFLGHDLALKYDHQPSHILDQETLNIWDLSDLGSIPLAFLSAGQRKRVALAHRCRPGAKVWLMDEPFANLDARQSDHLRETLGQHAASGGAALCSVHGDELPGPTVRLEQGRAHVF